MASSSSELLAQIERLYTERYRSYYRLALSVTSDTTTARDAVQEGFARALSHHGTLRNERVLESWICRIVIRCALDSRRDDAANTRTEMPEDIAFAWSPQIVQPTRDPELTAALKELPPRQRTMVFLRYFADLPLATIADVCGTRVGTVSATLAQAKGRLGTRLGLLPETTEGEVRNDR